MVYFHSNYVLLERDFGSSVGEDMKLGLGNSVWSIGPLLLGKGLINMLEEVNWGRNPNRFNRSIAQAHENWGRTPNRRRSQRLSQDRSLRRGWVSPPRKNFKNASLKPCILVYSWSVNLYFSHRIQEFSEEGLKPDLDLLFQLLKQ